MVQYEATVTKAIFAAAIAQNAGANYDVPIPGNIGAPYGEAACRINSIVVISEENLDWEIWLWSTSAHSSNRNLDSWLGRWSFVAGDAVTETADPSTSYRYFIPDLNVPYRDDDTQSPTNDSTVTGKVANGRIHMTLIPRGAAHVINKEIVIKFFCEPDSVRAMA